MAATNYARVQGGVVMELFTAPDGTTLAQFFNASVAAQFVPVGNANPQQNWLYDGHNFSAPPAPSPPTLAQQAQSALNSGITVNSTGTPALNGIYACDLETRSNLQAQVISILLNGTFTNGTASLQWPDISGAMHTFDVTHFKAFATAIGNAVGTLKQIIATGAGTLPTQPLTIA